MLHIQRGEQFERAFSRIVIAGTREHRQERHVIGDIEKRDQVRRLKHETDLVAAQSPQVAHFPFIVENHLVSQHHATGGGVNHGS